MYSLLKEIDPIAFLTWMTVFRMAIGLGLGGVMIASLYKFRKAILTALGFVMLTNLISLYILLAVLTK